MTYPQGRLVGSLAAIQVVGGVGNGAGLAIGALLVKDVSGSSGWAGTATAMLTIGAALATVPLARWAMRSGRRPALTTGWLIGAAGALVSIVGADRGSLPIVLLGLVLFGASTASNLQSRFAATDQAEPRRVARSLSVVVWATTIGAVAGPNLTRPGARLAEVLGVPELAGPLVFSVVAFTVAGLLTFLLVRPDPLARAVDAPRRARVSPWPHLRGRALTAVVTIAASHAVMVSVMSLTPVHLEDHGADLEVIGLTISLHIAGMFALSPVFGWLSDRIGPAVVVLAGQAVLVLSTLVSGTAGHSEAQIMIGLVLLGLGWSMSVIAAAAMLTTAVSGEVRPAVQGIADLAMNVAGATGGLLAGLVMAWRDFGTLNAAAAVLTIPVIGLVVSGSRAAADVVRD
ncbi:MAG: MFS transporter [Aeromicrobium sp.]|uniref:MFS transporter n=1 Tax=Aeromicrobium sp. TaxID=1871063 RepID=UPI0025B7AE2C|nr:MFS transporter [Aeromicrobium sp.]MDF1703689.1 MFS transporter [Aeromicrobium sp.]